MISAKMPIYCATSPVDLRRSFDGLAAAAKETLGKEPQSGALFLFVNKAGNRLKALWWDRTGYCVLYKRLGTPWKGGTWNVNLRRNKGTPISLRGSSRSGGDPRSDTRGDEVRR